MIAYPGAIDNQAFGINDAGVIVGIYALPNGDGGGFIDIGGSFGVRESCGH